jgi:hypothetical protein
VCRKTDKEQAVIDAARTWLAAHPEYRPGHQHDAPETARLAETVRALDGA